MNTAEIVRALRELADRVEGTQQGTPMSGELSVSLARRNVRLSRRGVGQLIHSRYLEGAETQGRQPGIYIDVRNADGSRKVGFPVTLEWKDGSDARTIEAKPGETFGLHFPLYASGYGYTIHVNGWEITGMGLGSIAEPNVGHHVVYEFIFVV